MSETFAVNLEYGDGLYLLGKENPSLTGALYSYLTSKGITVYKADAPVIMFEGESIQMMTRKCVIDVPMHETFDQIYDSLVESNIDTIFLYQFITDYQWSREFDASYQPVGEPCLREYRTVRFGVKG